MEGYIIKKLDLQVTVTKGMYLRTLLRIYMCLYYIRVDNTCRVHSGLRLATSFFTHRKQLRHHKFFMYLQTCHKFFAICVVDIQGAHE